jgi:hypothetical protein
VTQIKLAVLIGDPLLIGLAATWLALPASSSVRLRLKLEELHPYPELWRPG